MLFTAAEDRITALHGPIWPTRSCWSSPVCSVRYRRSVSGTSRVRPALSLSGISRETGAQRLWYLPWDRHSASLVPPVGPALSLSGISRGASLVPPVGPALSLSGTSRGTGAQPLWYLPWDRRSASLVPPVRPASYIPGTCHLPWDRKVSNVPDTSRRRRRRGDPWPGFRYGSLYLRPSAIPGGLERHLAVWSVTWRFGASPGGLKRHLRPR